MQTQTIFELYIDDKKPKYSSNAYDILMSPESYYEKLCIKVTTSKTVTVNLLAKFLKERQSP